jgi:hypothetical protein
MLGHSFDRTDDRAFAFGSLMQLRQLRCGKRVKPGGNNVACVGALSPLRTLSSAGFLAAFRLPGLGHRDRNRLLSALRLSTGASL